MSKQGSRKSRRQSDKPTILNSPQLQMRPFASLEAWSDGDPQTTDLQRQTNTASESQIDFNFGQVTLFSTGKTSPISSTTNPVQTKLTIGQPGDKYEQEADQVASQVVKQINRPQAIQPQDNIQRDSLDINSGIRLPLQRQGSVPMGSATDEFETSLNHARSGGSTLEPKLQTQMGTAMGADFSGVRVHTDTQADQLNRSIQAKAFTTGQDIFFRQGTYAPQNHQGQELIAHELTHVVQQTGTQQAPVQRKLSNEKIEEYKEVVALESVSIVEMPEGDDGPKLADPFSTYPDTSVYNLPGSLSEKSLLNVTFQKTDDEVKTDWGMDSWNYYANVTAFKYVKESNGGGAFLAPSKLAVICEGMPNRALLHEMGHSEQQERLGAQVGGDSTTVNQIILEYHNIMTNENLHDFVETDKGYDDLEIRTYYNHSNLNKHKDKTWQDLTQAAIQEYPLNGKLLSEIRDLLDYDGYEPWAEETERNLISEYFKLAEDKKN